VKYVRLYAGPDGESHFADVDRALEVHGMAEWHQGLLPIDQGAFFLASPPGREVGWHNAPRRQLLLTLSGETEYRTSDGDRRTLGAGSVLLVEDLTGKGHQTLCTRERLAALLPLADGALSTT
jgi:hypothetical protein